MAETEDQPRTLASPTVPHEVNSAMVMPPWMRELGTRPSRASSIISTRTRFSTNTLQEDARSIDIDVGGQYFRISRDGSRITDAPPPYSGPPQYSSYGGVDARDFFGWAPPAIEGPLGEEIDDGALTPRSHSDAAIRPRNLLASIVGIGGGAIPSAIGAMTEGDREFTRNADISEDQADVEITPSRNPSYRTGPEVISVPYEARRTRTVSQNDAFRISEAEERCRIPLKRRNGVRLPSLITDSNVSGPSSGSNIRNNTANTLFPSPLSPLYTRSAGPVLGTAGNDEEPLSPNFIGRNARGMFPSPRRGIPRLTKEGTTLHHERRSTGIPADEIVRSMHGNRDENATPPPMDNENDISLHYARIIRRLDQDHRRALHAKDKELAGYRERLHETDTVYRQELKARDFIIDDLRKRIDHLQENMEALIERARNDVEDLWESRWKEQAFHLNERIRNEVDGQRNVTKILARMPETSEV